MKSSLHNLYKRAFYFYQKLFFEMLPKLQRKVLSRDTLLHSFILTRRLPVNLIDEDLIYFQRQCSRVFSAVTKISLNNCIIDINQGIAIKLFSVLEESLMLPAMRTQYGLTFLISAYWSSKPSLRENVKYILLYNSWSNGYGHWLSDVVPRFFLIKEELSEFKIILPYDYQASWRMDTLLPFGIRENNIEYIESKSKFCKIPQLTVVSHIGSTCNVKDSILQEIRQFYWQYYNFESNATPSKRIYVSRQKCARRFVINEDEIQSYLECLGFDIVCFEDYSFDDQVKISSNTQVMIGLTGSGLNNMMFMPSRSHVLEFKAHGDYHNLHYFGFASGLLLNYWYLICETDSSDRFTANFYVNLDKLKPILSKLLQEFEQ